MNVQGLLRPSLAALACCLGVGTALAAPPPSASTCVACHGARGEGNPALGAPALAGQQRDYLARQLRNYRSGLRGAAKSDSHGAQMRAAVTALKTDAEVAAVAAHYSALPPQAPSARATGDLRNGQARYLGNCGACHGARAEGNPALAAPRLAGLDAANLKRQYQAFQKGLRGTDPKDTQGRQMRMMAGTLPAASDLDDVIAFIHAQGAPR